ncbi:MAG: hypothetical protein ACKOC5_06315 [Chloroflexota bacterium]
MQHLTRLPRPLAAGLIVIAGLLGLYVYIYQASPLPGIWSDVYLNLAIVGPSLLAAYLSTRVLLHFHWEDGPWRMWMYYSLALWSWAIAEVIWFGVWLAQGDVPIPSWADVFWLFALAPFAMAFLVQFRLIFSPTPRREAAWMLAISLGVLLFSGLGTLMLGRLAGESAMSWGGTFLEVFYAVVDVAMMIAALALARTFGRGLWGRAWWGLLAFALSDGLYSYVNFTGLYAQSVSEGNLLTLVVDSVYSAAYMLMVLAVWGQLLLMQYGPSLRPSRDDLVEGAR